MAVVGIIGVVVTLGAVLGLAYLSLSAVYGKDFAQSRLRPMSVAMVATTAAVGVVFALGDDILRERVQAWLLLTAVTIECWGIIETIRHRRITGGETLDLGPYPARRMLYLGASLMLVLAMMSAGQVLESSFSLPGMARTLFLLTSGSLIVMAARSHVRITARGVHQFGYLVPWDLVESWEWQDYDRTLALRLNLRERYWFQHEVPIAIDPHHRETVHRWLMQRIPFRSDPARLKA